MYTENPSEATDILLALISEFSKVGRYNQHKITTFPSIKQTRN